MTLKEYIDPFTGEPVVLKSERLLTVVSLTLALIVITMIAGKIKYCVQSRMSGEKSQ
jgi:hypothetical protein